MNEVCKYVVTLTLDADTDTDLIEEALYEALSPTLVVVRKAGQKRTRLTDEEKRRIIEDRRDGMTYQALAYKYNVSKVAINKILRAAGLTKAWADRARDLTSSEAANRAYSSETALAELAAVEQLAE